MWGEYAEWERQWKAHRSQRPQMCQPLRSLSELYTSVVALSLHPSPGRRFPMRLSQLSLIGLAAAVLATPAPAVADIGSQRPYAGLFTERAVESRADAPASLGSFAEHAVDAPGVTQTEVHPTPP